jgi:isopentenyl diphosphate isomerase/L-lactate dehydrogenase-like FMN-dependent dehydrogenase
MSAVKRKEVIVTTHVLRGLVLGARGARIGRPTLYGLAAGGQDAVKAVMTEMAEELVRAMTVMGVKGLCGADKGTGLHW